MEELFISNDLAWFKISASVSANDSLNQYWSYQQHQSQY